MKPTGIVMACLLAVAAIALPATTAQSASAQAAATLNVPPVCLVDATGITTTVTNDMCGITVPAGTSVSTALPHDYEVGTHRITWNGLTDMGLRMSETQTIIVMDLTPPDLTPPGAVTLPATDPLPELSKAVLGDARAIDNNKAHAVTPEFVPKQLSVGTNRVTWTVTDMAGLTSTATQVVELDEPPTITCPDKRIQSSTSVPKSVAGLEATFTDREDGTKKLAPPVSTPDPIPLGSIKVKYTESDSAGSSATCEQTVYALTPSTLATLPSTNGVEGSTYGRALAFGSDTLFVGNPEYTHHGSASDAPSKPLPNSGLVHAYKLEGDRQYAEYTIKPETPSKNLYFGSALAVIRVDSTDVLVVGAYGKDSNVGEVYLHNAATGKLLDTIPNPNRASNKQDHFGSALASMGDKVIVGAREYDQPAAGKKKAVSDAGRVYVYNSDAEKQYEIPNPKPVNNGKFGAQVEATVDGKTERVYVGSRTDGTAGAVYVYDVTGATSTKVPGPSLTALRPSGFATTEFGTKQIRPASGGGVYVGEPGEGKIHEYPADGGARGEFLPQQRYRNMFGAAFDADDRLLYAGIHTPGVASPLRAFTVEDRIYADSFLDTVNQPTAYYHARFGYVVEVSGDRVAVTDILEKFGEDDNIDSKTRVRVLDLRTLDPNVLYPTPATITIPSPGSQTQSSAQQSETRPAQPQMTRVLEEPRLLSTGLLGSDKLRLTYNAVIDPFEVDVDDYVLSDTSLEVVAVDVSGHTVTLTYVGGALGAPVDAGAKPLEAELIGGIGYY
ncbi:MAG: HYR domain-containing protein [Thaumarchaeota archaeon S14]|nr:MAG: HYR domain-containing protein [Thaumarchaeota archaeon S14]